MNKKDIVNSFFTNKQITDGLKNDSIDGSGIMESVTDIIGSKISKFIYDKFNLNEFEETLILDVGCGQGFLVKNLNELPNVTAYGFEGSGDLLPHFKSENICVLDIGGNIPKELNKLFKISTSFEMMEHIPMDSQKKVWDNLRFLSDYHVCSIHKCPPSHEIHPTILTNQEWCNFFKENNIEVVEEVPQSIWNEQCAEWQCSFYFILKF